MKDLIWSVMTMMMLTAGNKQKRRTHTLEKALPGSRQLLNRQTCWCPPETPFPPIHIQCIQCIHLYSFVHLWIHLKSQALPHSLILSLHRSNKLTHSSVVFYRIPQPAKPLERHEFSKDCSLYVLRISLNLEYNFIGLWFFLVSVLLFFNFFHELLLLHMSRNIKVNM